MGYKMRYQICLAIMILFVLYGCPSSSPSDISDVQKDQPNVDIMMFETEIDTKTNEIEATIVDVKEIIGEDQSPEASVVDITSEADQGLDKTPPQIIKTTPGNNEVMVKIPFKIKVQFSEPIWSNTVNKNSFIVQDVNGQMVEGFYSTEENDTVAVFTPGQVKIRYASPYKVTLNNQIKDKAGNGLFEWFTFSFGTETPPNMETYQTLAAKFAPTIYQAVLDKFPPYDYITSFDFDGDIMAKNNWDSIKKALSVPSWVYYDVVETKSHYFIRYGFFYAFRYGAGTGDVYPHANDVSGAMVVVAKFPEPTPIAILTYFSDNKEHEHIRSYVTEESGIVPSGKDKTKYGVNFVFKAKDLFGENGRYEAYLTAQTHESCLWIHTTKEDPLDQWCELTDDIKKKLHLVKYVYKDGTPQEIKKTDSGFPTNVDEVSYGLKMILVDWWSRRDKKNEDGMFFSEFDYEPPSSRPDIFDISIPSQFIDPVSPTSSYKGRPPWAWRWQAPTIPFGFYIYDMPRGVFFIDPAYFFMMRHKITSNFDPKKKQGYSDQYCFNPYLGIDIRETDADCKSD